MTNLILHFLTGTMAFRNPCHPNWKRHGFWVAVFLPHNRTGGSGGFDFDDTGRKRARAAEVLFTGGVTPKARRINAGRAAKNLNCAVKPAKFTDEHEDSLLSRTGMTRQNRAGYHIEAGER